MARLARILEGRITPLLEKRVLKGEDYARLEQGESVLIELAREQQTRASGGGARIGRASTTRIRGGVG